MQKSAPGTSRSCAYCGEPAIRSELDEVTWRMHAICGDCGGVEPSAADSAAPKTAARPRGPRRRMPAPSRIARPVDDAVADRVARRTIALLEASEQLSSGHPRRARAALDLPARVAGRGQRGGTFVARGLDAARLAARAERNATLARLYRSVGPDRLRRMAHEANDRRLAETVRRAGGATPEDYVVHQMLAGAIDRGFGWSLDSTTRQTATRLLYSILTPAQIDRATGDRQGQGWRSYDMAAALERQRRWLLWVGLWRDVAIAHRARCFWDSLTTSRKVVRSDSGVYSPL